MKKKTMIIFEVDDTGREHEYGRYSSHTSYEKPFAEFLATLDLEIELGTLDILINGVPFELNCSNALYKGKSAFTREVTIRKNRWVEITARYCGENAIRVPINKEIERDKLIKRIQQGIESRIARDKGINEREDNAKLQQRRIVDHLKADAASSLISDIVLNKGEFCVCLVENMGTIYFDLRTFKLIRFIPRIKESMNADQLKMLAAIASRVQISALDVIELVERIGPLDEAFNEYVEKHAYSNWVTITHEKQPSEI